MKAENNVAHTYRCTHHDIGEEHDNHILVFRVKSKGAFWPSKQNLSKLATVWLTHFSEEEANTPLMPEVSRAASPFSALFYKHVKEF